MPLAFDRQMPGAIIVDAATGRRFANESHHYMHIGAAARARGTKKMWLIADSNFISRYGMGLIKPKPFSPKPWIRKGYLKAADSIGMLARLIDVDPVALEDTITRFNRFATEGKDLDFFRGDDSYSRSWGDPEHAPNPTLGPITTPPYYAVEALPGEFATVAGLRTNADAQVIGHADVPIQGLYAVGADSNSIFGGRYPGGGASIGPAMTFGYVAAHHIARSADEDLNLTGEKSEGVAVRHGME
jgi:succinate dehydrogenase/fumarate reductase flavoprotein subunit